MDKPLGLLATEEGTIRKCPVSLLEAPFEVTEETSCDTDHLKPGPGRELCYWSGRDGEARQRCRDKEGSPGSKRCQKRLVTWSYASKGSG